MTVNGSITTLAYGPDDIQHALIDGLIGNAFPAQQMIQMMGEIRVGSVESGNCSGRGHSEGLIGMAKMLRRRKLAVDPLGHLRILAMRRIDGRGLGPRG